MGLFVLEEEDTIEGKVRGAVGNIKLFLGHADRSPYSYLLKEKVLKQLESALSKLEESKMIDEPIQGISEEDDTLEEKIDCAKQNLELFLDNAKPSSYNYLLKDFALIQLRDALIQLENKEQSIGDAE